MPSDAWNTSIGGASGKEVRCSMSESSSSEFGGMPWEFLVFGAIVAGCVGMFASLFLLLPIAVLNRYVFHFFSGGPPDAFWLPWLAFWGLAPCVVLGYRSGRWWSFLGAAPVLVLWPLGTALTDGRDYLLTLPLTGLIAAALALGSALRWARERGRSARRHRPLAIN